MTPKSYFQELEPALVFNWIEIIRSLQSTKYERAAAETALYIGLSPISKWFAYFRSSTPGYDADQVVNDSICQFLLVYVGNRDFQFRSCGHIARILSKITTNQRRMAYRWTNQEKRTPHDLDGHSLPIESLDIAACTCPSNI